MRGGTDPRDTTGETLRKRLRRLWHRRGISPLLRLAPWLGPAVLGGYIYVNQAGTWIELPSNWVWAGLFETAVLAILLVGWGLSVRQTMAVPAMAVVVVVGWFLLISTVGSTLPNNHGDWLWAGLFALAAVAVFLYRRGLTAVQTMALQVMSIAIVSDWQNSSGGGLRDFNLYLNAGAEFVAGHSPYTTVALHHYPSGGLEHLPFLYAPPTLPVFGLLSAMPHALASGLWVGGSVALVVLSLRAFGLSWRWTLLAFLWTPLEQGLFVGNVAVPSVALLALALRFGPGLVFGALLKPQNGIVALWLLRERAWRALAVGVLAIAALFVLLLPLVGIDLWRQWIQGLLAYQQSEQFLPGLYGVGLGKFLPMWQVIAIAAVVVLGAFLGRGRDGLARFSLASVIASPSLWSHGFLFAIPAVLRLRGPWFWLVAGMLCAGQWPGPQLALGLAAVAWFVPWLRRSERDVADPRSPHPLGSAIEPWPMEEGVARRGAGGTPTWRVDARRAGEMRRLRSEGVSTVD